MAVICSCTVASCGGANCVAQRVFDAVALELGRKPDPHNTHDCRVLLRRYLQTTSQEFKQQTGCPLSGRCLRCIRPIVQEFVDIFEGKGCRGVVQMPPRNRQPVAIPAET